MFPWTKFAGLFCIFALFALGLTAQQSQHSRIQLNDTRIARVFSIRLTVFAVDQDLMIPFCGEGEGGTRTLCSLPTRLEVKTLQGWKTVKLKHSHRILGGIPPDKWKAQPVKNSQHGDFIFIFHIDEFDTRSGDELRLVVDTWPDEESMRSGKNPINFISSTFKSP